ncbi:PREDICTED: armadillo repeat-containing kinesin-like protein 1 isoform X1 [Brassica oleracea var. oleracea]|uniref:armadillo repeat-containing kinesin-like protein 1 isoform X1 n=1 Tax=Brassica oleracea var. oleracea TaxID=109376 RepID=UPI0006A6FE51|nr:PREDICTED: armadillo repeat-containing kinesin-like protein 1 isoform X1 [Brassica oleracea var. oleracea]
MAEIRHVCSLSSEEAHVFRSDGCFTWWEELDKRMKEDLPKGPSESTILSVASSAIANLAMNEKSQDLIMNKGGAQLLARNGSWCTCQFMRKRKVSQAPERRGSVTEIVRISVESGRDDSGSLARKILRSKA